MSNSGFHSTYLRWAIQSISAWLYWNLSGTELLPLTEQSEFPFDLFLIQSCWVATSWNYLVCENTVSIHLACKMSQDTWISAATSKQLLQKQTGLFPTIRVLQISGYSSLVPTGYLLHMEGKTRQRGKNTLHKRANFLFVLSLFTLHGACVGSCHCKERFYSVPVLLFSKICSSALASSSPPQTFRTDIIYLCKRLFETSGKPLGLPAVTFLGTDHLAVLHSSLSLLP